MANSYYDNSDAGQRFQPGTTIEAADVDGKFDAVQAGFDSVETDTNRSLKLPDEGDSKALTETALQRRNKVVGFDKDGKLVLTGGFTYRGDWTTATEYFVNDVFRDPATKNLYVAKKKHTSDTIANDLSASNIELAISVADVETAKTAAQAARDKAKKWAEEVEDTEVETGKYSALHHAAKAAGSASSASESADSAASAANFKGLWSSLTGSLAKPASVKHSGEFWELLNDLADVTTSEPGVSGDWTSKTTLTGDATGPIDMAGFALTADSVQAERYDLASISTVDTLDLATANEFTIDASSPRTLSFANVPGSARAMTAVLTISGASAITWPAGIRWHGDGSTAPELGATWTIVVLSWDGTNWSGVLGASA